MHRSRRRHFWILVDFEIAQNVRAACQSEHQPLFAISKKMIRVHTFFLANSLFCYPFETFKQLLGYLKFKWPKFGKATHECVCVCDCICVWEHLMRKGTWISQLIGRNAACGKEVNWTRGIYRENVIYIKLLTTQTLDTGTGTGCICCSLIFSCSFRCVYIILYCIALCFVLF